MASPDFFIAQGNRLPLIQYRLIAPDGTPVDLTGCTVAFKMSPDGNCSQPVMTGTPSIIDAKGGAVQYAWGANDTANHGTYKGCWTVTTSGGLTIDYPNNSYIVIKIRPKV